MLVPKLQRAGRGLGARRPRVVVLGSTGSIGASTLDLLRRFPDEFEVFALSANSKTQELAAQAREFQPRYCVVGKADLERGLKESIRPAQAVEVLSGEEALCQIVTHPDVDIVVAAIVGFAALPPVLAAVKSGKRVALANKECLVCAGKLICEAQSQSGACVIPVDSEHSAIFQALNGVQEAEVSSLILTASGGPFLNSARCDFPFISPEEAVRHPRWSMGAKISVDSATLMNKALELIEAHWLFGIDAGRIQVVVHPESIVHSAISLCDGAVIAQLSVPDMRGPIAYALSYPARRLSGVMPQLNMIEAGKLTFLPLDEEKFPAVSLARAALARGGAMGAVFNCANEEAVGLFMEGMISFDLITELTRLGLERFDGQEYSSLEELREVDRQVRRFVREAALKRKA